MTLSLAAVDQQVRAEFAKPVDRALAQLDEQEARLRKLRTDAILNSAVGYAHNCARGMQADALKLLAWDGKGESPLNIVAENVALHSQVERLQGELASERARFRKYSDAQSARRIKCYRVIDKLIRRHAHLYARYMALVMSRARQRAA